jgi:hypothetical protein
MYFSNWPESEEIEGIIIETLEELKIPLKVTAIDDHEYVISHPDNVEVEIIRLMINEDTMEVDYEIIQNPVISWLMFYILHNISDHEYCVGFEDRPGTYSQYAKKNGYRDLKYVKSNIPKTIPGMSEIYNNLN